MSQLTVSEFDEIRRPNNFFLTFENMRARQSLLKQKKFVFAGYEIKIREPCDPSDIQWANYGLSNSNRCGRITLFILVCLIILGVPAISSFVILIDWVMLVNYMLEIPILNCEQVEE